MAIPTANRPVSRNELKIMLAQLEHSPSEVWNRTTLSDEKLPEFNFIDLKRAENSIRLLEELPELGYIKFQILN